MSYEEHIDPELRILARRIPFNQAMIPFGNAFQSLSQKLVKIPKEVATTEFTVERTDGFSVKTTVYEPKDTADSLPSLLYIHGGAFSYTAAACHKELACIYATEAHCRVFFPDYHLTPKFQYPIAYHDVVSLYRYIADHSEELHVDKALIGLAGDSAGASLAALLCNRYEKEALPCPCAQLLVYPVTDAFMETESMTRFTDTPLWNAKSNALMWSLYLQEPTDECKRSASPMYNTLPTVIPETYIETAEYDCLHDEGILYGEKLRRAGATVEMNETTGTFHGYDVAIKSHKATESIEKRVAFLNRCFQKSGS